MPAEEFPGTMMAVVTTVSPYSVAMRGQIFEVADPLGAAPAVGDVIPVMYLPGSTQLIFMGGGGGASIRDLYIPIGDRVNEIQAGIKIDFYFHFDFEIQDWVILLDQSGSIVVDLWVCAYAGYPPVVGNSICGGGTKLTVATAVKAQAVNLTGWTTAITAGSCLRVNVVSASVCTSAMLALKVEG